MEDTTKIKRSALVLLVVVSVVILYYVVVGVSMIVTHGIVLYPVTYLPDGSTDVEFNLGKNILYFVQLLVMLSVQICAVFLLLSIRKEETPFTAKNVKLLKVVAIMLMAFEPLQVISARIPLVGESTVMDGGTTVPTVHSMSYFPSGVILVVGIVVFCVALIFDYGISLQKQSDETL